MIAAPLGGAQAGLWLALGASLAFSVMNALAKAAAETMPAPEVAFFRGVLGTLVTVAVMRARGISFRGPNPRLLTVRGLCGGVSLLGAFLTLAHLPMADASLLAHLSPLFVVGLAWLVLGERPPAGFGPVLALALVGGVLVIRPGMNLLHSFWAIVGLLSALVGAGASISIRRLSADHSTHLIMLYFMGAAALVPLPFCTSFQVPGSRECGLLLALGAVSYLGQYLLTLAYSRKEAASVAVTRYAGIFFNVALGVCFFREVPDGWTFLGGALILAACARLWRLR